MASVDLVEGMIDIIRKNLIAKTNVVSDVITGDIMANVDNAFHFDHGQEIVFIDYNYNVEGTPQYQVFEYSRIDKVENTDWITLTYPIESTFNWTVNNSAFVQKTIGSSPLYYDRVYYGDREVIPTEEMAITVEPLSMSNEWIYLHGGLSEEYRVSIMIYGKDIETEDGMKVLNKYADATYTLFNKNIHMDVDNYSSPIIRNIESGTNLIVVSNTPENKKNFQESIYFPDGRIFEVQDNMGIEIDFSIVSVEENDEELHIYLNKNVKRSYSTTERAAFMKHGMYLYDSRIDNIEYGVVQKGSAFIRAARLNWFGKQVVEHKFPQKSQRLNYFPTVSNQNSSSSGT